MSISHPWKYNGNIGNPSQEKMAAKYKYSNDFNNGYFLILQPPFPFRKLQKPKFYVFPFFSKSYPNPSYSPGTPNAPDKPQKLALNEWIPMVTGSNTHTQIDTKRSNFNCLIWSPLAVGHMIQLFYILHSPYLIFGQDAVSMYSTLYNSISPPDNGQL